MRWWDPNDPESLAADEQPWGGPLASLMRPMGSRSFVLVSIGGAVLMVLAAATVLVILMAANDFVERPALLAACGIYGLVGGIGLLVLYTAASPRVIRRVGPVIAPTYLVVSTTMLAAALAAAGPRITILAAVYVPVSILVFYLLQRFWAALCNALAVVQFGAVTWLNEWPAPVVQWVVMLTLVVATGVVVSGIAERSDVLAASEHEARLETAEMNRTLEERVASQVTEIERLGQLRRFLSPQVADAVMSGGSESLAQPHRQRIAVCFCDLRGFTAFTRAAEPEEVLAVLDEYYRAVGEVLQKHDATIGGYAGDGIMAYFGDPVPLDDPARAAVMTATELRQPLDELVERWERQRFDLGYGIGLSYGFATLGVVGFDGRYDYTPLGAVVNLAARLCARAENAQILMDHATHLATAEHVASAHHAELDLKGYTGATSVYALA